MTEKLPLASLAFVVVYGAALLLQMPIVYYLPVQNDFIVSLQAPAIDTPVMSWYGYLTLGFAGAILTLIFGVLTPRSPARLSGGWYLYLPASILILILVKESHWFLK